MTNYIINLKKLYIAHQFIGVMSMTRSHAIILGGGYAGLLAAKVLASYYKRVSIIERYNDILAHPESTSKRQAVPQAAHIHVLLKGGQVILQDMFPPIINDLEAHCPRMDWARDTE